MFGHRPRGSLVASSGSGPAISCRMKRRSPAGEGEKGGVARPSSRGDRSTRRAPNAPARAHTRPHRSGLSPGDAAGRPRGRPDRSACRLAEFRARYASPGGHRPLPIRLDEPARAALVVSTGLRPVGRGCRVVAEGPPWRARSWLILPRVTAPAPTSRATACSRLRAVITGGPVARRSGHP